MGIKIKPTGWNYMVEMESVMDRKSAGGLYIPDTSGETTRVCKVTEVGPGAFDPVLGRYRGCAYAEGTRLLISAYAGMNVDAKTYGYLGDKFKLIAENEVIALIGEA